jgi:outer membrane protein assembly factor BamB
VIPGEDAVADGHGGWFVSGVGIAHVRSDGSVDRSWHAPVHKRLEFGTLARYGSRVFVSDGARVFAFDAGTGRRLWASRVTHGPGSPPFIASVAAGSGRVYLAGSFRRIGGIVHQQLAALDDATGRLLPWNPPWLFRFDHVRGYVPGTATALALASSRLFVIGRFGFVSARHLWRFGVVALRASDGALTSFAPHPGIARPNLVAAAGRRVLLGGTRCSHCDTGVFDARTGKARHGIGFSEVLDASVIGVQGSTAYLGMNSPGDGGHLDLMAIDLRTGRFEPWWPQIAPFQTIKSIVISGVVAFVGGEFCRG